MTIQRIKEIALDCMLFSQANIDSKSTKEELLYFAGYNDAIGSLITDLEMELAIEKEKDTQREELETRNRQAEGFCAVDEMIKEGEEV